MPVYSFKCLGCGTKDEYVHPMKKCDMTHKCLKCGIKMVRDFQADLPFASGGDYRKPIHSDALAISPTQRAEHEQRFPNIKLDKECRPVFSNYNAHDKYLKETGFRKKRQKTKPRGKRIA